MLENKNIDKLVEIIKAYDATLTGVDVKKNKIIYYVDIVKDETDMPVKDVVDNLYKVFWTFTFGESNPESAKLELKYNVINGK